MEETTIKIIMTKFLKSLVTIRDMMNNHLVKKIIMKKNISITIIIIKMDITKIHKRELSKNTKWLLRTEDLTQSILRQL
jgi:hypothetical protein